MELVNKWTILDLNAEFISTLRMACVMGNGQEALLVTKDDEVYVIGTYLKNCLLGNLPDGEPSVKPMKVPMLCGINIEGIAYCSWKPLSTYTRSSDPTGVYILVRTKSGKVYDWGKHIYYTVVRGRKTMAADTLPSEVVINKVIIQVACASSHSMVLTDNGTLYTWGYNRNGELGYDTSTATKPTDHSLHTTPKKVKGAIHGRTVVTMACGEYFSMALLHGGELFSWGHNGNGELGLGCQSTKWSVPKKVANLEGVVITQVVCGWNHTLALSENGVLYVWGNNSSGQLATGDKKSQHAPKRITTNIGRITEIAATQSDSMSVVKTHTSKVYMWGKCGGLSLTSPTETPFKSINDVFACCASPAVTFKPIVLNAESYYSPTTGIIDSLTLAFDDTTTSDIRFSVEGKLIHAHKAILKIRCEHFKYMFQSPWEEDGKTVVEIEHFSYTVYHAFLKYLYTGEVNLEAEDAMGLFDLANSYLEPQLKRQCELFIHQGISVENAIMLYEAAIRLLASDLQEFCFRFIINHFTAVSQTPTFAKMDEDILRNLVVKAGQQGALKH